VLSKLSTNLLEKQNLEVTCYILTCQLIIRHILRIHLRSSASFQIRRSFACSVCIPPDIPPATVSKPRIIPDVSNIPAHNELLLGLFMIFQANERSSSKIRKERDKEEWFFGKWQKPAPDAYFLRPNELFELSPDAASNDSKAFQEVLQLWSANFGGPVEPTISKLKELVRTGVYRVLILTQSDLSVGNVAAFAILSDYGHSSVVHLEYLAVTKVSRGKGLGTNFCQMLVRFFEKEEETKLIPHKVLSLECDSSLIPFYSRIGWVDTEIEPKLWLTEMKGELAHHPYYFLGIPIDGAKNYNPIFNKEYMRSCRDFLNLAADNAVHS